MSWQAAYDGNTTLRAVMRNSARYMFLVTCIYMHHRRRVDDPGASVHLNVSGCDGARTRFGDAQHGLLDIVRQGQGERLEISDDLVHVFNHATDGLMLMEDAVDAKRPHGGSAQRRQEQSPHGIAQRVPEAAL